MDVHTNILPVQGFTNDHEAPITINCKQNRYENASIIIQHQSENQKENNVRTKNKRI